MLCTRVGERVCGASHRVDEVVNVEKSQVGVCALPRISGPNFQIPQLLLLNFPTRSGCMAPRTTPPQLFANA